MSKSSAICYNKVMATNRKKSTSTSRRTSSSGKSTRRTSSKKAKVYIPAYKVIMLCGGIIAICMLLLLVTTVSNTDKKQKEEVISISQRFEQPIDEEKEKLESVELKNKQKTEEVKAPVAKKTETKKSSPQTVTEPKKTEVQAPVKQTSTQDTKKVTETKKETVEVKPAQKTETKTEQKTEKTVEAKKEPAPAAKTESKAAFGFPKAVNNAQLIFVFDDGGQNLNHLEKFMQLPFPITVAVLPQIAHSVETATRVRKSGNEVILHQPMQAVNKNINPGPGAITEDMSESEIISQLFININQISPIAGLNNHEGSLITADAEKMALVMQMASDNGIYFLDSRTNVETKVPYVASELGYSYYERNIFLDNEKTRENTLSEIKKGLALANKNGSVIMIGHIWSADYLPQLLLDIYPELKEKGYTFSVVSKSRARK